MPGLEDARDPPTLPRGMQLSEERRSFSVMSTVADACCGCSGEASHARVVIDVHPLDCEPVVVGYPPLLLMAFVSLLRNSIEAYASMHRVDQDRTVEVVPSYADGTLYVRIIDKAGGIAARDLPHIFDRYFTTKLDGAGLGLSIARVAVEDHQGRIDIESSKDGGTVATVQLPASIHESRTRVSENRHREIAIATPAANSRSILIVDDNYTSALSLASYLRSAGLDVSTAYSSEDAAKTIREAERPFDVALIDVCLPEDHRTEAVQVEGFNVARLIKEVSPTTRVVGMSEFMSRDSIHTLSAHFDECLQRPLSTTETAVLLKDLAERRHGKRKPSMFIVHGHDEVAKTSLRDYLVKDLGLNEPIILQDLPSQGRTVIEKFEEASRNVDVVFVLLTPDDIGGRAVAGEQPQLRARQNVILELGFFLGYLRRTSGRVILLHKGPVELPSDILGLVYIDISRGIRDVNPEIRKELAQWL